MKEWIVLASNIVTGGLRVTVYLFIIYRLLTTKKPDKRSISLAVAGVLVITICLSLIRLPDFYRIALEAIMIAVCANRYQKADTRMCLFISIFYEIGVSFGLFLFSAGLGVVFHSDIFFDNTNFYGQVAVWVLHLFLIALAFYISKRSKMERKDGFRLASIIVLAGFFAVIALSEQTILPIPEDTLWMWTILAVVLSMSVLIFNMNRQYEVEKELAKLKSEQAKLWERDYTVLNNSYAVNAKLFHDIHNHIGALRQLLSHQKYDKALQYLDELQEPIREITDTVWTGDETVDYLINSKAAVAVFNQIHLQVQVEFPRHTNIRSVDLCAILGNLLDNALEAVKEIKEPEQRIVHLTIRRINQILVIKVENYFSNHLVVENDKLQTTKTEAGLHGWGLKNAQTAAEKYDGVVKTTYEGNTFRAVATLSYHGVGGK
jgi:hypothetical protein